MLNDSYTAGRKVKWHSHSGNQMAVSYNVTRAGAGGGGRGGRGGRWTAKGKPVFGSVKLSYILIEVVVT